MLAGRSIGTIRSWCLQTLWCGPVDGYLFMNRQQKEQHHLETAMVVGFASSPRYTASSASQWMDDQWLWGCPCMIPWAKHAITGFSLNWIVVCEGPAIAFPWVGNWIDERPDEASLGVGVAAFFCLAFRPSACALYWAMASLMSPFSQNMCWIWRRYCDIVSFKTSQQMSGGLYNIYDGYTSVDQYSDHVWHMST